MTEESRRRLDIAARVAEPYRRELGAVAAMVSGSAAEGVSDAHSDLDMMIYYSSDLPADEDLARIRTSMGASERIWAAGDRESQGLMEALHLEGVEVQLVHTTTEAVERDMAVVLDKLEVDTPLQKMLSGIQAGVPLYGKEIIGRWKARADAYPDALAEAMVRRYLQFFPVWAVADRVVTRDATLWLHQIRVEILQNLLGVLAGLNRLYFSTFQFKRTAEYVGKMRLAPMDLADRIQLALGANVADCGEVLRDLVRETVDLVEEQMSGIDVSHIRQRLD